MNIIKNTKKKFILLALLISFFGVLTIFLGIYAQEKDQYVFYTKDVSNELFINEIRIGDSIVSLEDYQSSTNKYKSKIGKITLSAKDNYILEKSKIDNLKLSFENNDNENKIIIVEKNGKKIETIDLPKKSNFVFMNKTGTYNALKTIVMHLSILEIVVSIFLFILFFIFSIFSLYYIESFIFLIKNNGFKVSKYLISVVLLFILNLTYIYPLMQINKFLSLIPMLITLIIIIKDFSKVKNLQLHNYYIVISIYIGVLFLLIFPPLHVPDEFSHFVKSYQSSFVFQDNHEIKKDATYVYLPEDIRKYLIKYGNSVLDYNYTIHPRTYLYDLLRPTNYEKLSTSSTWYSLKYSSSVAYLPGTIISFIARISHLPILLLNYFSKLITYIITTLMCYYAIKIVPKFKKVFFIVPLLPIFIQQSFGFNVDWLTNATFILLLSFIIKEMYNENDFDKTSFYFILFLSFILGFGKFGYFPVALLFLLLPVNKNNKLRDKKWLKRTLIILIAVLTPILVTNFYKHISPDLGAPVQRNVISISALWTNPKMVLSMVIETFKVRLDLDLFRGLVTGFGWSTIWSNSLFVFISLVILMTVILCDDKYNNELNKKQKLLFFITFLLICGIIYAAMLFGWSEVGVKIIDGLQPRYFIPPVILLYILLQNNYIKVNVTNKNFFYSISLIIINVLALFTIIDQIYI